jgi:hypothetical protein
MHIENGLGGMKSARAIAKSLKVAADASEHLTGAPFHAAMAALDHLIEFLDRQKERLEKAKVELRKLYGERSEDEPKPLPRRSASTKRPADALKNRKRTRKRADMAAASWGGLEVLLA